MIREILVIHTGALGDFLLSLPAIRALRRWAPRARLEILGRPAYACLALDGVHADAVHDWERPSIERLFTPGAEIPEELRRFFGRFDLAVPFLGDPEGSFDEALRRAGCRRVVPTRLFPPPGARIHAADHAEAGLAALGIEPRPPCLPWIRPPAVWWRAADRFLDDHGVAAPPIVVHPGSGSKRKNWPAEAFGRVVEEVASRLDAAVIAVSGEAETDEGARLGEAARRGRVVPARSLPLPTLAGILARCRLALGNDSGVMHLAAAVGAPTVAVFGPSDPSVWGPRGDRVRIVRGSPMPDGSGISSRDPDPAAVLDICLSLLEGRESDDLPPRRGPC